MGFRNTQAASIAIAQCHFLFLFAKGLYVVITALFTHTAPENSLNESPHE